MSGTLLPHPRVELRANLKSISHKCYLFEVAVVCELTKETIHLPLGCLQGGFTQWAVPIAPLILVVLIKNP